MSKFWIIFWLFIIFIWPFVSYFVAYNIIAPKIIGNEVADISAELQMLSEVKDENIKIKKANEILNEDLAKEKKYRAEAEARIAIVENARATATENLQKSEDKIFELKNKLGFYSALIDKSDSKATLQCFNIQIEKKSSSLSYKVNFMINDANNKKTREYKVKFRIIGAKNLSLEKVEDLPILHTRDIKLKRDVHLTGNIKVKETKDTLSILDIRAYDKSDSLVARCWKAV